MLLHKILKGQEFCLAPIHYMSCLGVVEDDVTGYVVRPGDVEAITRWACRILDDPELRARFGAEARRRATERFDLRACVAAHVRAYEQAIERRGRLS